MICIASGEKLSFESFLGQQETEALEGLRLAFVEKYGADVYTKATMVIVYEENFFNVIKNIYGVPLIGLHTDLFDETLERHLEV